MSSVMTSSIFFCMNSEILRVPQEGSLFFRLSGEPVNTEALLSEESMQ
jgi:hypothetical protein